MWPVLLLLMDMGATHQAALAAYKQHKFAEAVTQFTEALKTENPGTIEYGESVLLVGQSLYLSTRSICVMVLRISLLFLLPDR